VGELATSLAARVHGPGVPGVDDRQVYRSGRDVQAAGDRVDVLEPVLRGKRADDLRCAGGGCDRLGGAYLTDVAAESVVDEGGCQRLGVAERRAQRGRAVVFEQLGGVGTGGQDCVGGVVAAYGQAPVGALGGVVSGGVGVGGDGDAGSAGADEGT